MASFRRLLPLSVWLLIGCSSSDSASTFGLDGGTSTGGGSGSGAGGSGTGGSGAGRGTGGSGAGTGTGGSGAGTGTGGSGAGTGTGGSGAGTGTGGSGAGTGTGGSGARDAGATGTDAGDAAAVCPGTVCGTCTDLKTDPLNCGACGTMVCHNEACNGGRVCAAGLRPCGGAGGACLGCKNLTSDPANCGACGTACTASQTCVGFPPQCKSAQSTGCSGGLTLCPGGAGAPGACVDTTADITNCGACGKNCSPGEYCVGSACTKYVPAPGCTACPCAACTAPTDKCCRYTDGTVCSSRCFGS
jgi:hypothetical protein